MLKAKIEQYLTSLGQPRLLLGLPYLNVSKQESFLAELQQYDIEILKKQKAALFHSKEQKNYEPLEKLDCSGSLESQKIGMELLAKGKVGCLILAGGQGSRLAVNGPKGMFPITPFQGKSLFQFCLERSLKASERVDHPLPIALMTSTLNHEATFDYLKQNHFFGFPENQIALFQQKNMPLLDDRGNWLLSNPGEIAVGPNGNGEALKSFFEAGIYHQWKERGIEYVTIILIDNILADPFDHELCGYHHCMKNEATLKAVPRIDPAENVGLLALRNQKICVLEYSELSQEEKLENWKFANTGLFCFSMPFIERASLVTLPLHIARKRAEVVLETSKGICREEASIWKCETFIFDLLESAQKVGALVYPREQIFAPIKGKESIQAAQEALFAFNRTVFHRITGIRSPVKSFELDPAFYYPTEKLIERWKGRSLPDKEYIEAEIELC